jgi:hypothetical protein
MTETKMVIYSLTFLPQRLYQHHRTVSFISGEGIVRSSNFKGGTWRYLVEPQGREPTFAIPEFGRVGAETIVLLDEVELDLIGNQFDIN